MSSNIRSMVRVTMTASILVAVPGDARDVHYLDGEEQHELAWKLWDTHGEVAMLNRKITMRHAGTVAVPPEDKPEPRVIP